MLIITTQTGRKLVKCGGYAYFESCVSGGITSTQSCVFGGITSILEEGPKTEKNKTSGKRHNTDIGMINNFFRVNN